MVAEKFHIKHHQSSPRQTTGHPRRAMNYAMLKTSFFFANSAPNTGLTPFILFLQHQGKIFSG